MRWIAFFIGALLLSSALRHVPAIGGLFGGLWGFWIAALLLSAIVSALSTRLIARAQLSRRAAELSNVDTSHNQGKLGSLELAHGSARRACVALERAVAGEPDNAEWRFRLGQALARVGRPSDAVREFERALDLSPGHAYGEARMELGRARLALGDAEAALDAVERFDRDHGASPRSAYLRGCALRRLGRTEQARAAFARVAVTARATPRFARKGLAWLRVQAALRARF